MSGDPELGTEQPTEQASSGGGMLQPIRKFFKMEERQTTFTTEIRAGMVTFFTMAYILAVNPVVIAKTGGPCVDITDSLKQAECLENLKKDLVTATGASACIGTLIMALAANLPHGLAPGMGMNFYFVYSVVGVMGSGTVSYGTALAAVFLEGIVFIILALTGIRLYIAKLIPQHIKSATTVGIGLFIALIGLGVSEGIGVVSTDPASGVTLGGCGHPRQSPNDSYMCAKDFYGVTQSTSFMPDDVFCSCDFGDYGMSGATSWVGILGFVMICIMMMYKVKGGVMIGIMFIAIISWFRGTSISWFPDTPAGNTDFEYFKKIADIHAIKETGFALNFKTDNVGDFVVAFFTFLYVDIFDTTGTLYSMTDVAGLLKEDGNFDGSTAAFTADAIGTVVGALMGTSPVTTYIESGAGIIEGGKTGFTALTIAILFAISCFFAPIFANIPPWASGGALVYVGCMMTRKVSSIDWEDPRQGIPAACTIFMMPFTYSIAYGIITGLGLSYLFMAVDFIFGKTCGIGPLAGKKEADGKIQDDSGEPRKVLGESI